MKPAKAPTCESHGQRASSTFLRQSPSRCCINFTDSLKHRIPAGGKVRRKVESENPSVLQCAPGVRLTAPNPSEWTQSSPDSLQLLKNAFMHSGKLTIQRAVHREREKEENLHGEKFIQSCSAELRRSACAGGAGAALIPCSGVPVS